MRIMNLLFIPLIPLGADDILHQDPGSISSGLQKTYYSCLGLGGALLTSTSALRFLDAFYSPKKEKNRD